MKNWPPLPDRYESAASYTYEVVSLMSTGENERFVKEDTVEQLLKRINFLERILRAQEEHSRS